MYPQAMYCCTADKAGQGHLQSASVLSSVYPLLCEEPHSITQKQGSLA